MCNLLNYLLTKAKQSKIEMKITVLNLIIVQIIVQEIGTVSFVILVECTIL